MSRIFLSHSSADSRVAIAVKQWLVDEDPSLADEIFLDLDPTTGIAAGVRWKEALIKASDRCEAVVCLQSNNWINSSWCVGEFRAAELHKKQIFAARLEPITGPDPTDDWQHIDLFGPGPAVEVDIGDGGGALVFSGTGLRRLRDDIWAAGIGAKSFPWPPAAEPGRVPYRGWEPFEAKDAGVFFGRDTEILRATEAVRGMRKLRTDALFVVLGPSGAGKSSFLRAGVLPRLQKDRGYLVLDIVRPDRNALTGESGLAQSIWATRNRFGLGEPPLGDISAACLAGAADRVRGWLRECQTAAAGRLFDQDEDADAPTLVLPLDQAEELFSADAGAQAPRFMRLLRTVICGAATDGSDGMAQLIVAVTIRTDRYELMQTAPELAGLGSLVFDDLKPMKPTQYKEVITGPAQRSIKGPRPFQLDNDLVARLLADASEGADALPLLSLTLARLYHNYGSTGRLTLAPYEADGGMAGVVRTEIDGLLSSEPAERAHQLDLLRAAFVPWLATVHPDNDQPLRRVARWDDLPAESRPLIEGLVANRLLVADHRDGTRVVEVALESLLRQWDELAGWLRERRADLKTADNIERNTAAWQANGRDDSWLLAGTRLTEAETLFTTIGFQDRLASSREYLSVSRRRENERQETERAHREAELDAARERADVAKEKQQTAEAHAAVLRRRGRVLHVVGSVAVVVALVAAAGFAYAMVARGEAQRRTQQVSALQLVEEARAMLTGVQPGTDADAFQQLLAAGVLSGRPVDGPLLNALMERPRTLKIMNTPSGVAGLAFSPDGDRLAAGTADGSVLQWNPRDGKPIGTPLGAPPGPAPKAKPVSAIAFTPDGAELAVGRTDGGVSLVDADTGAAVLDEMHGHRGVVTAVAVSGDHIVSAGADRTIRVWNIFTGRQVTEIDTGSPVFAIALDPAGVFVASAGADGRIQLWDSATWQKRGEFSVGSSGAMSVAVSSAETPGGQRIAAGDTRGNIRMWRVSDGTAVDLPGHTDAVMCLAFSPSGDRMVSGGGDQTVRLWQVDSARSIGDPMVGHDDTVWAVAFGPGGHTVASGAGIDDRSVRLWNADQPIPVSTPMSADEKRVNGVAFAPDAREVVSGGGDHRIRLWDTDSGQPLGAAPDPTPGVITSVAFDPGGDRVMAGSADGTVSLWAVDRAGPAVLGLSRSPVATLRTPGGGVQGVAFSPRGDRIAAAATDGSVWVWQTDSLELIRRWPAVHAGVVFAVAFSPDGDRVASGGVDGTVRVLDVDREAPAAPALIGPPGVVTSVSFAPDGTLATAGAERRADGTPVGVIRLWNVDRREMSAVKEVKGLLASIAFSPDGGRLVTGGFDHFVSLWRVSRDRSDIERIGDPLPGHEDGVSSVDFNTRGDYVVSGGAEGTVRIWSSPAESDLQTLLCTKLTANMSRAVWATKLPTVDYVQVCPDLPVPGG